MDRRNKAGSTPALPLASGQHHFMASRWLASLSMSPFDFSKLEEEARQQASETAKFYDKGYTTEQVEAVLSSKHGMTSLLLQEFPRSTMRGAVPHAFIKALWIFEEYGRDTSYSAVAAAMEVTKDTAKEYLREARGAVRTVLGVEILTEGDYVRLVVTNDAHQRAERVLAVFKQQVEPALKKLEACAVSLAKSGSPVALSARAMAILEASKVDATEAA